MKIFGKKLEDFYKWVKGTELVILEDIDVKEDPVRPELTLEWRKDYGRQIFGLKYEDSIEGVVCVAYTKDVPHSVRELELMSENASMKSDADTAVAYTVWSRKRGAGKEIITKLMEHVQKNTELKRMVTLSPLTPMATHFHIRNGAKLIKHNPDTQNFEYKL
jgi:hypothetical protein|tara:strand:+ start:2647 stop:3132 length:486 start_codon:yes stop_codon:yes gene_type:complete